MLSFAEQDCLFMESGKPYLSQLMTGKCPEWQRFLTWVNLLNGEHFPSGTEWGVTHSRGLKRSAPVHHPLDLAEYCATPEVNLKCYGERWGVVWVENWSCRRSCLSHSVQWMHCHLNGGMFVLEFLAFLLVTRYCMMDDHWVMLPSNQWDVVYPGGQWHSHSFVAVLIWWREKVFLL